MQLMWLVANFDDTQTEQSDISGILQLIRKHEAESPARRIIMYCSYTNKVFRLEKMGAKWGPRKKSWCQKEVVSGKGRELKSTTEKTLFSP